MQTKNAEIVMKLLAGCIACMRNSLTIAFLLSGLKKRRNIGTTNHNTIFLVSDLSSRQNWNRKKLLRNIRNKFQTLNTFFTAAAMALLIPFKKTFAPSYSWCFIYTYILLNSEIWWWWYFQWYQTKEYQFYDTKIYLNLHICLMIYRAYFYSVLFYSSKYSLHTI